MRRRNPADSGPELLQEFATQVAVSDNFSRLSISLDEAAFMLADFAIRTLGPLVAKEAELSWAVKALRDHTPVTDAASATKAGERARYAADYVTSRSEAAQVRRPRECADALRALAEVCFTAKHKPQETAIVCADAMEQTVKAGVSADAAVNAARRFLGQALRPKAAPQEKTVKAEGSKSSIMGTLRGLFSPAASARAANPSKINARVVNRALTKAGIPVTIYKGNGYFYYEAADTMLDLDSTYVCYWDDLTLDEWVEEVRHKYEAALRRSLKLRRTPNHHRTGLIGDDYPIDPYRPDLDTAFDPYDRDWRTPNPSSSWDAHYDAYYNHPSVRDHVAVRITAKGREALAKKRGSAAALRVLALLADTPSLPQFVIEGEFGIGHEVLSPLLDAGLISAAIEARPRRPIARSYADEYAAAEAAAVAAAVAAVAFDLDYQHREMLRQGRFSNPRRPRR